MRGLLSAKVPDSSFGVGYCSDDAHMEDEDEDQENEKEDERDGEECKMESRRDMKTTTAHEMCAVKHIFSCFTAHISCAVVVVVFLLFDPLQRPVAR